MALFFILFCLKRARLVTYWPVCVCVVDPCVAVAPSARAARERLLVAGGGVREIGARQWRCESLRSGGMRREREAIDLYLQRCATGNKLKLLAPGARSPAGPSLVQMSARRLAG